MSSVKLLTVSDPICIVLYEERITKMLKIISHCMGIGYGTSADFGLPKVKNAQKVSVAK